MEKVSRLNGLLQVIATAMRFQFNVAITGVTRGLSSALALLGNELDAILFFVLTLYLFLVESTSSKSLSISEVDFAE